ncbi:NIF family HAD-type phosphatase [Achromobacter animicus]|uniref:NIF family HAD-type phosphatase n=1 Tax=Achromobacter animicus TaxID=1389935 RepID=UPI00345E37AB
MPQISLLALDLEGTLISNAISQIPRPGLSSFLISCRALFPRIVMYTTVSEARFRAIARLLVSEGEAPDWFAELEVVDWNGQTKDLALIPSAALEDCLLVDDFEGYVHRGQREQWVRVACFSHPYVTSDRELENTLHELRHRINHSRIATPAGDSWHNWFDAKRMAPDFMLQHEQPADEERNPAWKTEKTDQAKGGPLKRR